MKKLTEQDRQNYVQKKGGWCPYCGSKNIESSGTEFQGDEIYQTVECNDCGAYWEDIFRLTGILSYTYENEGEEANA